VLSTARQYFAKSINHNNVSPM